MSAGERPMRVLVIGKDARTDAIAAACLASGDEIELYGLAEMRHPGLADKCRELFIVRSLAKLEGLDEVIQRAQPDLAIIGPEEPLDAGYADALMEFDVPAFGPTQKLAEIESSKSWTRQLLESHGIPGNPEYRAFADSNDLRKYMEHLQSFVIKPDGLTGGKGVRVFGEHLHSIEEALTYATSLLEQNGRMQVEERLEGEEFSLQTITDGESVIHLPLVQDHKRAEEGDKGPNTGGMGSYSCPDLSLPFLEPTDLAAAKSINEAVVDALHREVGRPYRGVLYGGFMAVASGVRLIEYNARFGDPEAMNVLPLLNADFVQICEAAAHGKLARVSWSFEPKATVCKYLVPADYPGAASANRRIDVPEEDSSERSDLKWYWAACEERDDGVYMTPSRAGAFVGIGDSLEDAEQIAERAAQEVEPKDGVRHRRDIGQADLVAARVGHMESLRPKTTATLQARSAA